MWIQGIQVGVLRVFVGIPGFLGLPGVVDRCPRVALRPVSGVWVNRSSKCAGHRQKVSAVTGSPSLS